MKKYFIVVQNQNEAILDTQIIEALTPTNALIKYLNEKEINENDKIIVEKLKLKKL